MFNIQLRHPVTHDNQQITSVQLRRAKVKDIEAVQIAIEAGGEMAGSIASISALCGLHPDVVREIDAEDFTRIAEAMKDFLPRATGGDGGDP